MIRALAPDRADQAFNIAILPGRAVRRGPVPDPHCSHTSLECNTECSVVVANEIFRCSVPGKRFGDLARQPLGRRIAGHREPQQPPPLVPENQKCEKLLELKVREDSAELLNLVDELSSLSVIEASDLAKVLQDKWRISSTISGSAGPRVPAQDGNTS